MRTTLCGRIYIIKVLNHIVLLHGPATEAGRGLRRFFAAEACEGAGLSGRDDVEWRQRNAASCDARMLTGKE